MNIASLCRRELVSVPASASVRMAAEAMRAHHVGALAVTDPYEPARVVGILTDRDLVVDLLAPGRPVEGQPVGALCKTALVGVPGEAGVKEAIDTLRRHGVRRLFVTEPDGSIRGLVSVDDLFEAVARELGGLVGALRIGMERESARREGPSAAEPVQAREPLYLARNEP